MGKPDPQVEAVTGMGAYSRSRGGVKAQQVPSVFACGTCPRGGLFIYYSQPSSTAQMPPKSRRAYFKSFFRFGSSKREVKGRPSGEHRLADDIATSGTLNEPSVSTTLPSLTPYLGHDVLTTQDDAVEPRLDSGITMGNLLALASSPTPTPVFPSTSPQLTPHSASSSLFANAQNFHLQNLHYYHQIPSPGLDSSSRSATGQ